MRFGRIQFTRFVTIGCDWRDGIRTRAGTIHLRKGPIFAHLVLVDEINRTSPKVQSALLEAMAESQVTIDNTSHDLGEPFMVIATQNPLDSVGTHPLPQAQLDRFLFKISMKHIARECELQVMRTYGSSSTTGKPAPIKTTALVKSETLHTRKRFISRRLWKVAYSTLRKQHARIPMLFWIIDPRSRVQ